MKERIVRIGGASGFWGDTSMSAPQLLASGQVDYLVFDYLAEVTMSIMTGQRARDPQAGYAVDFVQITMRQLLPELKRLGVKVVANAGGVNPLACRDALRRVADELGVPLKIGVVLGDDLLAQSDALRAAGITEMFDGSAFPAKPLSINAYLGATPIAEALDAGCEVVITGRCVDSAVTLGVLLHEFQWAADDWDRLAQGSLAGHLIECGAQCTGGLFTDWDRVPDWENIGSPILEASADGSFVIGKPAGTGGLVEPASVAEQLLYEIGDPRAYLMPDVTCDFTQVRFESVGEQRVRVSGARGRPPTPTYKVSTTYMDGYKNTAILVVGGERAAAKARRTGEAILARTAKMLAQQGLPGYTETRIEVVGAEDMFGAHANPVSREVVLKMAVKSRSKESLALFAREFVAPGTSMAPGTTGLVSGRPAPSPVIRLFSFLYDKGSVPVRIDVDGDSRDVAIAAGDARAPDLPPAIRYEVEPLAAMPEGARTVPLIALAFGRSGDKGDKANIGLIARRPDYLPLILRWVTAERVAEYFAHCGPSRVERFDLPGFDAVNFVLHDALGGGGVTSLRTDNLAKAFAQVLLTMPVPVPDSFA
ncbi:MAG: acyclic terpene utilization AtuA family protein [Burkholderiaceae bacterium]